MGPRNKGGNTVSIMNDGVHGDCSTGNLFESKFWLNFKSKAKGKKKKKKKIVIVIKQWGNMIDQYQFQSLTNDRWMDKSSGYRIDFRNNLFVYYYRIRAIDDGFARFSLDPLILFTLRRKGNE